MNGPAIVFIVGPTATRKTEVALALAKKIKGEIISCDSMQIYQGLEIASNKPPQSARKKIPHHMMDIVPVKENFDVARYFSLTTRLIRQIHRRGHMPLIVGGTGLYMTILLDGIFQGVGRDESLRTRLEERARKEGLTTLYVQLKDQDPQAASKIHPHDQRRIIRALEVCSVSGQPISKLQNNRQGLWGKYRIKIFSLNLPRKKLYERIDQRVEEMFARGLVEEIEDTILKSPGQTALRLIGLKEIQGHLKGQYDLQQAKDLLKRNTRHYAKRQLTWFRKDQRITWIDVGPDDTAGKIALRIGKILKENL